MYLDDDDEQRKQPGHREGIGVAGAMARLNESRARRGLPPLTEVRTLK